MIAAANIGRAHVTRRASAACCTKQQQCPGCADRSTTTCHGSSAPRLRLVRSATGDSIPFGFQHGIQLVLHGTIFAMRGGMLKITTRSAVLSAVLASSLATVACAKQGKPTETATAERVEKARGEIKDTESVSATVESVDQSTKTVFLRDDEGRRFAIEADENAAARLRPNDKVKAVYQESLAFALEDPTKPHDDAETKVEQSAEKKGADGVQFGRRITTTVHIVAVAPQGKSVEFRLPEGQSRTVTIQEEKHQAAVQNLHPGDSVQVTFTEKLALAVDESAGS